jgi:sugar phosphate isomerase/epimerase
MRPLGLDHLSLYDLGPAALARVAVESGFQAIGLFIEPIPFDGFAKFDLSPGSPECRETRSVLSGSGLGVSTLDPFLLLPEIDFDRLQGKLDTGALLGARAANVVVLDPDPNRRLDHLGRLFPLVAARGLDLAIEPYTLSEIHTAAEALALADGVSRRIFLTIDTLHVRRAGNHWSDIAAIPKDRIAFVQFSDGPAAPPENLGYEATFERQAPGESELDLRGMVALIPDSAIVSVEAPSTRLLSEGVSAAARAARLFHAARRMLS